MRNFNLAFAILLMMACSTAGFAQITGGGNRPTEEGPSRSSSAEEVGYGVTYMNIKFGADSYYAEPIYGLSFGGCFPFFRSNNLILGGRIEGNIFLAPDTYPYELSLDLGLMGAFDLGGGSYFEFGPILSPSIYDEFEEVLGKFGVGARYRYGDLMLGYEYLAGAVQYDSYSESFGQNIFSIGFSF